MNEIIYNDVYYVIITLIFLAMPNVLWDKPREWKYIANDHDVQSGAVSIYGSAHTVDPSTDKYQRFSIPFVYLNTPESRDGAVGQIGFVFRNQGGDRTFIMTLIYRNEQTSPKGPTFNFRVYEDANTDDDYSTQVTLSLGKKYWFTVHLEEVASLTQLHVKLSLHDDDNTEIDLWTPPGSPYDPCGATYVKTVELYQYLYSIGEDTSMFAIGPVYYNMIDALSTADRLPVKHAFQEHPGTRKNSTWMLPLDIRVETNIQKYWAGDAFQEFFEYLDLENFTEGAAVSGGFASGGGHNTPSTTSRNVTAALVTSDPTNTYQFTLLKDRINAATRVFDAFQSGLTLPNFADIAITDIDIADITAPNVPGAQKIMDNMASMLNKMVGDLEDALNKIKDGGVHATNKTFDGMNKLITYLEDRIKLIYAYLKSFGENIIDDIRGLFLNLAYSMEKMVDDLAGELVKRIGTAMVNNYTYLIDDEMLNAAAALVKYRIENWVEAT